MRRRLALTLLLALTPLAALAPLIGGVTPALAQRPDPAPAAPAAANPADAPAKREAANPAVALIAQGRGQDELLNIWRNRTGARDEPERAEEQLDRLWRTAREAGITRLDAFAAALLREAETAARADDFATARQRIARAEQIAAGLPEILDVQASIALADAPWALHTWVKLHIKAFIARVGDFQRRMLMFSDFVLGALLILGLLGVLFTLAQFARHAIHLFHDLGTAFPSTMRIVLLVALALVLALPLIYGFGPVLLFFPLAIAMWSYQGRSEKVISALFIVFLGSLPWLLRMGDRLTEAGTGPTQALHALSLNPTDARALEAVEAAIAADPNDWAAQAVLGLTHKRLGRLDEAETALRAAIRGADGEAEGTIYNTLGNVLFAQGRATGAEEAYTRARKRLPEAAEPVFNLHRLYRRLGRGDDADAAIQAASVIDAQAVAAWSQDDEPYINRYVVDLDLPTATLTRRAMTDLFSPTPLARRAWVAVAGPVPEMTAPLAGLATLILFGALWSLRRRMKLTWPCYRCARPAPGPIADGPPAHPQCEQCVNLFVRNIPVDRRVRFTKEQTIARWSSFRRYATRLLGLTVPGLVDLVRGHALRGVLVAGVTAILALWLVLPDGLLLGPLVGFGLDDGALSLTRWVLLALVAASWIMNVVRALRWKERA